MRTLLGAAAFGLAVFAAGAASAAEVSPETDKLLWCGSAFFWLAGSADDSGDAAEAELYDGWSMALIEKGAAALEAAGAPPEEIEGAIAQYIDATLEELDTEAARYDVLECPELVEQP
jgi:hypothetical protein